MNKIVLSHLALILVNLIYGASVFIAKGVMPNFLSPNSFILIRVISATILFWMLKTIFVQEKIAKKDIKRIAICGLFGVSMNMLLFFKGLSLTSPIDSSVMMMTTPVLVTFLSFLILKNKLTTVKLVGVLLGLIGAIYLIYQGADNQNKESDLVGNLLVFLNASSYGIYLVLVKPLMKKYSPITIITLVFTFGLLYVLPFGLYDFITLQNNFNFDHTITISILFIIIFTTFTTYILNIFALKHISPTVNATYIYLQPVFAMVIAWFISLNGQNGGFITIPKIAATLLIFLGVFLISKKT